MKRRTVSWLRALLPALAISSASIRPVNAASFDCAKAGTLQEEVICATPSLSKLDGRLSSIYKSQLGKLAGAPVAAMRDSQREWVEYRKTVCPVVMPEPAAETPAECMINLYEDRLKTLSGAFFSNGPYRFVTIQRMWATVGRDSFGRVEYTTSIVSVPWLLAPAGPGADRFNAEMKRWADRYVTAQEDDGEDDGRTDYEGSVEIVCAGDTLISLQRSDRRYAHGAAHGLTDMSSVNWLWREGRVLRAEDLFRPGSNWQAPLTKLAYEEVKKAVGATLLWVEGPDELRETAEDPTNWVLGPDALSIQFGQYEVGAYVIGAPLVGIPWGRLKPYLAAKPPRLRCY